MHKCLFRMKYFQETKRNKRSIEIEEVDKKMLLFVGALKQWF